MIEHVSTATRERTQTFLDTMPDRPRRELRAILRNAAHLFTCTPYSYDTTAHRYTWLRDQAPAIDGPGCTCVALPWNGCVV